MVIKLDEGLSWPLMFLKIGMVVSQLFRIPMVAAAAQIRVQAAGVVKGREKGNDPDHKFHQEFCKGFQLMRA
jgi:hypothetical protein